jgi:predicted dinucleotide-binding enzyme
MTTTNQKLEGKMKIAVLGAGNVGGTIGKKLAAAGHEVAFGVRDAGSAQVRAFLETVKGKATATTLDKAITFGEVVFLAIPGEAVEETITEQADALRGKIVVDATNKFGAAEMSSVATLMAEVPEAKVFRAFNSLGWENFAEPWFGETQADLLYCGADEARPVVEALIADVGLRPIHVGGLDQVQVVDGVGVLWGTLAYGQNMGRRLAFKVLTP